MNENGNRAGSARLLTGLAIGSAAGAGLALWLAPRAAAEIRERAAETARALGDVVSGRYRFARVRLGEAVDGIARKGQGIRNEACDTVVRAAQGVESGARGVQQFALDAKARVS